MNDDLMNKASEGVGAFERVLRGVPGYKGYKEKELRRETDKSMREMMARQLMDQRDRLSSVQSDLVAGGQLGLLDNLERTDRKMVLLADRVRTASYGYAPLFDDLRVKEDELDALAAFDETMMGNVSRVASIIDNLTTLAGRPEEDWSEGIRALSTILDSLNTEFGHRSEVIMQTAPEVPEPGMDIEPADTDQTPE
jgi:hypothetical protein